MLVAEPRLLVDAEHAADNGADVRVGMGMGGVPVAVDVCDYHEGTVASVGVSGQGGGVRGWGPSTGSGRTGTGLSAGDSRIAPTVGLAVGLRDGWWWGRPAGTPAPLDSCLRRNDEGGGQEWRGGRAGTTRDGDAPARRPCPGFPLSRERRWGWAGTTRGVGRNDERVG